MTSDTYDNLPRVFRVALTLGVFAMVGVGVMHAAVTNAWAVAMEPRRGGA